MPKLAEGYTTKYGFQCLEKNVTRFEAEHAFQISPEPLVVEDINQYIVMTRFAFSQGIQCPTKGTPS